MQIKLTVVVVVVGLQAHFLTFFFFARLLFVSDFVALSRSKERILFASFFSPPLSPAGHPLIQVVTFLKLLGTAWRFSGSKNKQLHESRQFG